MILFKRSVDMAEWLERQRESGNSIGFVPTLGALHAGHISLISISKKSSRITVCSIFINPTQFNDPKDFQKYPITLEKDIALLEEAGADVLYLPEAGEVYPGGTKDLETYDLGPLETILEGKFRPGHFQGVCQVMRRLLDLVRPDDLYMGQKDYQQCMVVQRLLVIRGMKTRLHPCPIVREPDGLAMSSRNVRLSPEQRVKATAIYQALLTIKRGWEGEHGWHQKGEEGKLTDRARAMLEKADFRVDYVEIADAETLEPELGGVQDGGAQGGEAQDGGTQGGGAQTKRSKAVALIAAFQGEVRLIDNMML
jgi:pantoate--beta-alanine ligase